MVNKLRYRRQFILSRNPIQELEDWRHQSIDTYHLYAHNDLEFTKSGNITSEIFLLGYVFDPTYPNKGNQEILDEVISSISQLIDLFFCIKRYVGRYVIIYRDNENLIIFHDCLGLREIYYCLKSNLVICGSQPNLLAKFSKPMLDITREKQIQDFYLNDMKLVRSGRAWVGPQTLYQDIEHLMPNDYLDVNLLKAKRYWPNSKLNKIDVEQAADTICHQLQGVIKAAANRYKLMAAVTSGIDSRSLLAASRDIKERIYFFINRKPPLADRSPDIRIPKSMFEYLHLPFHVHDATGPVEEDFKNIFLTNTFASTELLLPAVYNVYFKNHQDKVNLLGVGEIGRGMYGPSPRNLDGYYLAYKLKYRKSKYVVEQCKKWLENNIIVAREYNYDIMTLFLIWGLSANWGAVGNSESDIAIEEFNPYNSHQIYETMLAVDWSQRAVPDKRGIPKLYDLMFKKMWPELLNYPFNPPSNFTEQVIFCLKNIRIYGFLKKIRYWYDRWKFFRIFTQYKKS